MNSKKFALCLLLGSLGVVVKAHAVDTSTETVKAGVILNSVQPQAVLQKAVVVVTIDEVNVLRQAFNALRTAELARDTAVANATSLADLKTRWAAAGALPAALPDRTRAQALTAVQNALDAGLGR